MAPRVRFWNGELPQGWRKRIPEHCEDLRNPDGGKTSWMSPEYQSWRAMLQRCYSHYKKTEPRNKYNKDLGIQVCIEWTCDFHTFLLDMGPRPQGHTLDRVDPELGYYPGNCRWADAGVQTRNRRSSRNKGKKVA